MVRSTDSCRRFRHCLTAWRATFVVGVAGLALGGCGVDRTGLESVMLPADSGTNVGNGDASIDHAIGAGGSGVGGAGGMLGAGGSMVGAGGSMVFAGTGGQVGAGGMLGAGGMVAGTGGMLGAGGMVVGSGGMVAGTGGMLAGTGGMLAGSGGMIAGSGGMIAGVGGVMAGTGGSFDGGTDSGAADAGSGGNGAAGTNGGLGGMPGMGGAPGLGGAGGATVCAPACGPCQRCTASHTCEVDPASTWDLAAISASLKSTDPHVQSPDPPNWDLPSGEIGGILPDPFVELDILSTAITPIGHSAVIVDSLLPNWGALMPPTQALLNPMAAPLHASDLMAGGKNWLITVFDDDVDTASGSFGETMCEVNGPLTSADFVNGGFTRTNVDSCVSISIKLSCHP